MSGWYGHVVRVNVDNRINFPKYSGRLSIVNPFVSEEVGRLERKMNYMGSQISYQVALSSQVLQRKAITELDAVDTGRLRESVMITGNALVSYIGTDLYYAEDVHDIGFRGGGFRSKWPNGVGPRPWTERAFGEVAESIDGIVKGVFDRTF